MNKEKYIRQEILKQTQSFTSLILFSGAFAILLLSILDYFVTPENFKTFFNYRFIAASLYIALFFIFKKINRFHDIFLIFAAIIASTMVELMILASGGHQSSYYAGFIIIIIFIFGLLPVSFKLLSFLALTVYAIYLIPILLLDNITNLRIFISNNIFLIAAIIGGLVWRYANYKLLIKELSLEYDLSKEKEQLAKYSTKLEELVQNRTKELSISEKKLRSLFEYATDGIMIMDEKGKILDVNKKTCDIYGFDKDALIGSNIELLEADKDKSLFPAKMERILKGESLLFETQHYKKDSSKVYIEIAAKAIEVEGNILIQSFLRDITEKKVLQEQLLQSQKMESIGALAGGIAHNFNNILTAILGNAELLQEYSGTDDTYKKRANNIQISARKAGSMISKLLSFARRDIIEILPLNLNDVINDAIVFEGVLGKKIKMKTDLNDSIPTVEGDRNQIEQVIMNLIVNARDAMPDGGLIKVTTSTIEVQKDNPDIPAYITPGKYVLLTVSDTGRGIPKDIINRIFDPFFTTKGRGKGTGLGLATVYGIVKDHNGYITVQSEPGKGTAFDIYLPVSGKPVYKTPKPEILSVEGHEHILVVDDEEDVLDFIKDVLETHGYKVMPTNNPFFAIDIFKEISDEIHLVITDNIMPLMDGTDLIKHLKAIKPDIKIITVSGYSDEAIRKDRMMIDAFIRKPFESYQLLSTVRRILDTGIRELPLY